MSHFLARVSDLFEHALQNRDDSDMAGITISNEEKFQNNAIGINFRRKDQLSPVVILSVFGKVAQSNATYNILDKLVLNIHYLKMPIGNGEGSTTKGRLLANMAHLKRSIVDVIAENNCLVHALIIAIAKLTNDLNYKEYRQGGKIHPDVDNLVVMTDIK
jgi:hypothetical protein